MTKAEAIQWANNKVTELAARLGLTHGAVSKWRSVPIRHQYRLAIMSKGKLAVDEKEVEFVKGH